MNSSTWKMLAFIAVMAAANVSSAAFIYSGDSSGNLYRTNAGTASSTLIGSMGNTQFDIAFNTVGQLYGVANGNTLYSINASTGASSAIGATGSFVNGLDFDSAGTLYGSGGSQLYTINTATGAATSVGNIGYTSGGDLAFASDGTLYMTSSNGSLISVNKTTGAGSVVGNIGFANVYGIDFIGSVLYGTTLGGQLITINTTTGAGTLVGASGVASFGSSVWAPVPEPASLAMWTLGALGACVYTRRRKRSMHN